MLLTGNASRRSYRAFRHRFQLDPISDDHLKGWWQEPVPHVLPLLSATHAARLLWPVSWPPESIAAELHRPMSSIRVIAGRHALRRDDRLIAFGDEMLRWRAHCADDDAVCWLQPVTDAVTISLDEAEQLLGLIACVDVIERNVLSDGTPCLILAGRLRPQSIGFVVSWPVSLLASRRLCARSHWRLDQGGAILREAVHLLEVPVADARPRERLSHASQWVRRRAVGNVMLGVYKRDGSGHVDAAMQYVRRLADEAGVGDRLACHRVVAASTVQDANHALDRCRRFGLAYDLSTGYASPGGKSIAYCEGSAYLPLHGDARMPLAIADAGPVAVPTTDASVLEDPRHGWWARLTTAPERVYPDVVRAFLARLPLPTLDRLRLALNRRRRVEYLERLQADPSIVDQWHRYHVYNWAPPRRALTLGLLIDAAALARLGSHARSFSELEGRPFITGAGLLAAAGRAARERTPVTLAEQRDRQVSAHEYLASENREALTADSEVLISRMPQQLGRTLEIGFGYGLMARRIVNRASLYVGLDLQVVQAVALGEQGGRGLVGDMQSLPFRDGTFDSIIADNVLEHASYPLTALRELRRVMVEGGTIYALMPLDGTSREFQIRTHLWKADADGVVEIARLAGLTAETEVLDLGRLGVYGCFP